MSYVCLRIPDSPTGAAPSASEPAPHDRRTDLATALLAIAPHVAVGTGGVFWLDARGLPGADMARRANDLAQQRGLASRAGVADTPIAAEVAATDGSSALTVVPAGTDADFLAGLPLAVLHPEPWLDVSMASVGLESCGDLARLTREAIEVRFGPEGVALWRLARADDRRRIFSPTPRSLPAASLAWEDYLLRAAEPIRFVVNRLVGTVCDELQRWGEAARALTLELTLADRAIVPVRLRVARATASRTIWMRSIRRALERLTLPDGVAGLALRVEAAGTADTQQGDMFDRGFQTAHAIGEALGRIEDDGYAILVAPVVSSHPLPEHRVTWQVREPSEVLREPYRSHPSATPPRLTLQLLPDPRPIEVVLAQPPRAARPAQFRTADGHTTDLLEALGPDRGSAGIETGGCYAREYFTCLTGSGRLILLFRDALTERWYLQGWWD